MLVPSRRSTDGSHMGYVLTSLDDPIADSVCVPDNARDSSEVALSGPGSSGLPAARSVLLPRFVPPQLAPLLVAKARNLLAHVRSGVTNNERTIRQTSQIHNACTPVRCSHACTFQTQYHINGPLAYVFHQQSPTCRGMIHTYTSHKTLGRALPPHATHKRAIGFSSGPTHMLS